MIVKIKKKGINKGDDEKRLGNEGKGKIKKEGKMDEKNWRIKEWKRRIIGRNGKLEWRMGKECEGIEDKKKIMEKIEEILGNRSRSIGRKEENNRDLIEGRKKSYGIEKMKGNGLLKNLEKLEKEIESKRKKESIEIGRESNNGEKSWFEEKGEWENEGEMEKKERSENIDKIKEGKKEEIKKRKEKRRRRKDLWRNGEGERFKREI